MGIRDKQTMSSRGLRGIFVLDFCRNRVISGGIRGNPSKIVFRYICEKTEPLSDKQKTEFLVANGFQRFEIYRLFLPKAPRGKVEKEVMHLASS